MKKIVQKQLGELLIESKMITPQQLEEALKTQKEKGGLVGQVLIQLGFTTEEAIAQALTTQYGFPYLPLAGYEIDVEIAKIIPEKIARGYSLIAIDRVGMILTVGMADPLNAKALQEIEAITDLKIQVYVCTTTEVNEAIARAYKGPS